MRFQAFGCWSLVPIDLVMVNLSCKRVGLSHTEGFIHIKVNLGQIEVNWSRIKEFQADCTEANLDCTVEN